MDVDIIDICTPPTLHVAQALAALAAGKHVICEKPIAGSLAEVDQLIAAEQAAPGRLMPIFQYRFGNGVQRAKRIVDLGLAGKPYLATVETAWKRAAAYYATPWRGRLDTELGGVLLTQAIHSHDLMTWLMGPVASVFAATATRVNPIEVEDCAVASLVLQNGALASLAATLGSHREISRLRFCFEHVTFESSQAPYSPGDDPWEIIPASDAAAARISEGLRDWTFVPSRFNGLMARYHAALEAGTELPITLADARQSLELVTALMHSGRPARASICRSTRRTRSIRVGGPVRNTNPDRDDGSTAGYAASSRWAMRLRMATSLVCRRIPVFEKMTASWLRAVVSLIESFCATSSRVSPDARS